MIETFFEQIIKELGVTGLLVVGLYFFLYRPLGKMATHLEKINGELAELIVILRSKQGEHNG